MWKWNISIKNDWILSSLQEIHFHQFLITYVSIWSTLTRRSRIFVKLQLSEVDWVVDISVWIRTIIETNRNKHFSVNFSFLLRNKKNITFKIQKRWFSMDERNLENLEKHRGARWREKTWRNPTLESAAQQSFSFLPERIYWSKFILLDNSCVLICVVI